MNIPLALVVLAITLTRVPESRIPEPGGWTCRVQRSPRWVWAVLSSGSSSLPEQAWTIHGSRALDHRGLGLAAFVVVESRVPEPMMPLGLFRSRNLTAANVFTLLLYFALVGTLFFLPFDLIWAHGYPAAGAAIVPTSPK